MKTVAVDANVVLSFVTDRDPRQQRAAARLFERAAAGDVRIVLPQVVLIEIVYVLENLYRTRASEVSGLLADLLSMPHVGVENEAPWQTVLEIWPDLVRDFAEAVLVTVARAGDHAIASFDRRLTRGLRRLGIASHRLL